MFNALWFSLRRFGFVSGDASHTRSRDNIIWDLVDDNRDHLLPGESGWLMSLISILRICCHRVATRAICASFRDNILHFILECPWHYVLGYPHTINLILYKKFSRNIYFNMVAMCMSLLGIIVHLGRAMLYLISANCANSRQKNFLRLRSKKIIHQDIEQSPLAKTPVLILFSIGDTLQPTEIIFHNGWIEACR